MSESPARTSWVPWWLDPYSDNVIPFAILFFLIIMSIIGSMWVLRLLVVGPNAGAHPITPPSSPTAPEVLRSMLSLL